jgi:hypothetical protein
VNLIELKFRKYINNSKMVIILAMVELSY